MNAQAALIQPPRSERVVKYGHKFSILRPAPANDHEQQPAQRVRQHAAPVVVDQLGPDRLHVLGAEVHDHALKILVVLPKVLNSEGRVHQPQRVDAEDGFRGGVAQFPATPRLVPREVDLYICRIVEMEQELSAVLGENEQLLQQKQEQDGESVWEQRYQ